SCIRSVPAGRPSSQFVSQRPYPTAAAAHRSAKSTAWCMNQLIGRASLRSLGASQSQRRLRSAPRDCTEKRGRSSGADGRRSRMLREDLLHRRRPLGAGELALGGVALGPGEPRRRAELLGERQPPLDELLEARAGGYRLPPLEVDQLAGE